MSLWNTVCSVHLCSSVRNRTHPPCEKKRLRFAGEFLLSRRIFLSLTELTDLTEHYCALFRYHRTPSAYRVHRALLLKMAVTFCEIGWLNVSVKPCVFCSSVFFCEKLNAPSMWEWTLEICWGVFSLPEPTDLTEPICAQFRVHEEVAPPPTPPPQGGAWYVRLPLLGCLHTS